MSLTESRRDPGSYRDPDGSVYRVAGRIFRGVSASKQSVTSSFLDSNFFENSKDRSIVSTKIVEGKNAIEAGLPNHVVAAYPLWLEHKPINLITYPYEWSFLKLKAAAVFHLQLQIDAINAGYQMKDSTAYNVQFRGCSPIFIDILSFEPYQLGSNWMGYRQFCEEFLAPLALNAYRGLDHQAWYRGCLTGIDLGAASSLLPLRSYLSLTILGNIHAQAWARRRIDSSKKTIGLFSRTNGLPKKNLIYLLKSLQDYVGKIEPKAKSYWKNYELENSYEQRANSAKEAYIGDFVRSGRFKTVLDLGCNTGRFSEVALNAGASQVIGLDGDPGALDLATQRADRLGKGFTPLFVNLTNPSPSLGWRLQERSNIYDRLPRVDALICLALIHHLVISGNIPLREFVEWCVNLAPTGVIEFVPRSDPMVIGLLAHRKDIFPDYEEKLLLEAISLIAKVIDVYRIPTSHRVLIKYTTIL